MVFYLFLELFFNYCSCGVVPDDRIISYFLLTIVPDKYPYLSLCKCMYSWLYFMPSPDELWKACLVKAVVANCFFY